MSWESYQHENPTLVKNLSEKFWLPTQLTSLRLSRCPLSQSVAGACTAVHCACYSVCLLLRREVGISDNLVRCFRMMGLRIRIWLSLMLQYSYSCHGADNLQLWGWRSRNSFFFATGCCLPVLRPLRLPISLLRSSANPGLQFCTEHIYCQLLV